MCLSLRAKGGVNTCRLALQKFVFVESMDAYSKEKDVSFAHNSLTSLNTGHSLQTAAAKRVCFKLNRHLSR